jgi:UDP-glucose 4-epimerase
MHDQSEDPLAEYRRVNVGGTTALARQAAAAGVRRFVYVSSIKVNGETTPDGQPFTETHSPAPTDPYGISKLEAEQAVFDVGASTGMEVVVVRPPIVYGAGVKANFLSMMKWLARGVPLPLGAIHQNRRSLVGLDNLVDFLITCLRHPSAANQVFVVSDGEDLSTTELLRRTASALGVSARLVPIPASMLGAGAAMLGKRSAVQRLCGSLQVDISKARSLLAWNPPFTIDEELARATRGISPKAVAR